MPCVTITVSKPEQPPTPPVQPPSAGIESYLPIVAILGAAALAYYITSR